MDSDLGKKISLTLALTVTTVVAYNAIKQQFFAEEQKSLYERIGGEPAVNAAVDVFYKKVLADNHINHFFAETNMMRQHQKQKNFLQMALGRKDLKYSGLSMDAAHRRLVREHGMNDFHFDRVAINLQETLQELNVPKALVDEVMSAVGGMREQVMCRGKWANASTAGEGKL